MGFQIRASQQKIQIDELEISLSGQIDNIFVFLGTEQDGHSGFNEVHGTIYVSSDEDDEVLEKLWEETLAASPVTNTMTQDVDIDVELRVI